MGQVVTLFVSTYNVSGGSLPEVAFTVEWRLTALHA